MPNVSSCQRPGLQNVMLLHLAEKAGLGIQQNMRVCVCEYVCLFLDVLLFILVGWPMSISCNGVRLRCQSKRALIWKSERDGEMVAREMRRIRSRKRKSWKNVWMEKMSERTRCEEEDRKEAIHTGACSSCATMTPAAGPPVTSLSSLSGCSQWELVTPVFQASH